ncbi:hypothetical protein [Gracilibacillus phocaeensis]|uniref:hypothetical protein n=1 Tax=Gracilibacillus phocaeensis TaxID=2042304 RepID=UPI001031BD4A|nr:hypothetical protein [Gracilibacillus phocaeensis]
MRLHKLEEKDFQVLRGPLESGRQSPKANSGTLLLAIPLAVFMYVILYVVLGWGQDFPYLYQKQILFVCFAIQVTMILSSIIFAVPVVYKRNENLQYAVFIVASQNLFTIPSYLMTIFIAAESNASNSSLLIFTFIKLLLGVLVFVTTCVRFSILLKKGQYRKGSKKDKSRVHLEKKSLISIASSVV